MKSLPAAQLALRTVQTVRNTVRSALVWGYEQRLAREVRTHGRLPQHLGLILDGNRRFARASGLQRELGHSIGADKAHEVLHWCLELGIPAATIWVLSTDNRSRDPQELAHILSLLEKEARALATDPRIHANRVRVRAIGQHGGFPPQVLAALQDLETKTAHYDGMRLNIAVGYGGREEIVDAVKAHLQAQANAGLSLTDAAQHLTPDDISAHLYAADTPDPDFIIRTSGEIRLSGFMLWQSVYSEYYFCDVYWPGFRRVDFLRALRDYQGRDRRFGR
ncbi:isoprenyl transferase [Deinococcus radiotolerans]|uniref:Isoprenyl transferase n=1 Tax=Deinococcus radiotolerans TaxID=1309407 RepID=A0ABQ2FJD2_9DEIO|nr:isoprenyl transferase [Deinococcus radiotolerans]GGL03887.1 isoprenyl transferase [Deinococcus radiotolerans]